MITNVVYRVKKDSTLPNGIIFKAGQEIEVVMDVIYIGGYPIPPYTQGTVYQWIESNPQLLDNVTRNF